MGSVGVHPSRFSPEVLAVMAPILTKWGWPVHDPFAGTGERMGALCDSLGLAFTGTEIEEPYIIDPRVRLGNSRYSESYPEGRYCIGTSPVYPNGLTDHFRATNPKGRRTYRLARAQMVGHDEPLDPDNMGRHGPRQGKLSESRYWAIAEAATMWWPPRVLINMSDCIIDDEVYPAVAKWAAILEGRGFAVYTHEVGTPRYGFGANAKARVDHEVVLECYWRGSIST